MSIDPNQIYQLVSGFIAQVPFALVLGIVLKVLGSCLVASTAIIKAVNWQAGESAIDRASTGIIGSIITVIEKFSVIQLQAPADPASIAPPAPPAA